MLLCIILYGKVRQGFHKARCSRNQRSARHPCEDAPVDSKHFGVAIFPSRQHPSSLKAQSFVEEGAPSPFNKGLRPLPPSSIFNDSPNSSHTPNLRDALKYTVHEVEDTQPSLDIGVEGRGGRRGE